MGEQRTEAAVVFANRRIYACSAGWRGRDSQCSTRSTIRGDGSLARTRADAAPSQPSPGAAVTGAKAQHRRRLSSNVHLDAQDSVFEYDPAADTWRTLAPLKSPRGSVGVAAVNGKIHAIGGRDVNRVTVATHEVYDPRTGKWSDLAPLPKARDHMGVVAVGGQIHAIGGRFDTPNENTDLHDVYDQRTNAWKPAAPLPTPRSGVSAVLYRGRILVDGGECNKGKPFIENEAYDVKAGRWSSAAPMPSGRHGIQAATDGQVVYIPGGAPACATAASDTLLTFRLP